jgi:hypothetical protein
VGVAVDLGLTILARLKHLDFPSSSLSSSSSNKKSTKTDQKEDNISAANLPGGHLVLCLTGPPDFGPGKTNSQKDSLINKVRF